MEHTECRAHAGAAAVMLLAIAGFFCIVFSPTDDTIIGWQIAQLSVRGDAHADANADAHAGKHARAQAQVVAQEESSGAFE